MRTLSLLALLAAGGLAAAKPPQAPPVQSPGFAWAVTDTKTNPCGKSACDCGCEEGAVCRCASRGELEKSYAKQWQAEGWTYDEAKGYWTKPAPPPSPSFAPTIYQPPHEQQLNFQRPAFAPSFQGSFGGGFRPGGRAGGC